MKTSFSRLLFISCFAFLLTGLVGCSTGPSEFEQEKADKEELIRRQEEEKARQRREKEDIQRQRYWNEQLKRYE